MAWVANGGREAIALSHERRPPDVMLVDMSLVDMSGTDVCREIRAGNATTAILGITSYPIERYAADISECGAQGIVEKTNVRTIADAIRTLACGEVLMPPPQCRNVSFNTAIRSHNRETERSAKRNTPSLGLREIQVLELTLHGYDQNEISAQLGVSPVTVRTYTKRIREKMDCRTLAQAAAQWVHLRASYSSLLGMIESSHGI